MDSSSHTTAEAHHKRVEVLSELSVRPKIVDETLCVAVLIDLARRHGTGKPEGVLISQLLRSLCLQRTASLSSLLNEFQDPKVTQQFVSCALNVVKDLETDKKALAVKYLTNSLLAQDSITGVSNELIEALRLMAEPELANEISGILSPYLMKADPLRVLVSVRVLSSVGGNDLKESMTSVLIRSIDGWYGAHEAEIQHHVLVYFSRNPSEQALPSLMKLLRIRPSDELIGTLKTSRFPSTGNMVREIIQESLGNFFLNYETIRWSFRALAEIGEKSIDPRIVVSHEGLLVNDELRRYGKSIILQMGEKAKPFLIPLAKDPDPIKFRFAIECLEEIGITADEQNALFGGNVANLLSKFFYGEGLHDIWGKKDNLTLGSTFKRADLRWTDLFILELLNAFNLQTLYVDPSGKPGVDALGLCPSSPCLIVAGVTSGHLKDDVSQLSTTLARMRSELGGLMERLEVLPVIFTISQRQSIASYAIEDAKRNGIIILAQEEIEEVLIMAAASRPTKEFIEFLRGRAE